MAASRTLGLRLRNNARDNQSFQVVMLAQSHAADYTHAGTADPTATNSPHEKRAWDRAESAESQQQVE